MDKYLSLKDHVYNYISELISKGDLRPGDKVSEAMVEEKLNISRTPVREALIQLASDGYLDNLPRKGFRVKNLDIEKAKDLYEIIGILDGRSAVMCLPLITDRELAQMQFLAESMESAINQGLYSKYYELQVEFHDVYLSLCPNKEIFDLITKLKNSFIRKYYNFENTPNASDILKERNQEHFYMIELFKAKDAEKLEALIRDGHWDNAQAKFDSMV